MRIFVFPLLCASLLYIKGCDLNEMSGKTPEQIQHATEQELTPYFPRARVNVSEEQRSIVGITCVDNIGKPAVEQIAPVLEKSEGVRQLRDYREKYGELEGLSRILGMKMVTYRYFLLGFDHYVIRLDADNPGHTVLPAEQVPHYADDYARACASPSPAPSPAQPSPPANTSYIWVGTFTATLRKAGDSTQQQTTLKDTLGMYTEPDFAASRAEEIAGREEIIRHEFEKKQFEVLSVQLEKIERMPAPETLEPVNGPLL